MNRFVIYYLQRFGDVPGAADKARQQLSWAENSAVTASVGELIRLIRSCSQDEVILMTDDLIGPIGADRLAHMLSAMESSSCPAWKLAKGSSAFLALRRELMTHAGFLRMLEETSAPPMESITAWLDASGLPVSCFLEQTDASHDPLLMLPYTAVMQYGSPFADLRCFLQPHTKLLEASSGEETTLLYRLLDGSPLLDWLWDRLLTRPMDYDLIANLGLIACMDTAPLPAPAARPGKVCLLMHLYYPELGQEALRYASSMPEDADIYITTSSEEKKQLFASLFSVLPNRVEIRVVDNRGRDMAGLLVGMRDVTASCDVCCFYHDKKSPSNASASVSRSFAYVISESALASRGYVERVLQKFHDEPRLGLLCPMAPHHGDYYLVPTHFWDHNYPYVLQLMDKLEIGLPVSQSCCLPVAWGNVFWFRTQALAPLLRYPWKHEDFPPEPYPVDGSIAHAIERAHCLIAQTQGYYTALAAPGHLMAQQMMNFYHYWQDYANEMIKSQLIGPHREVVPYCGKCLRCTEIRLKQKAGQWLLRLRKRS